MATDGVSEQENITKTITPFADPNYTMMHNDVIDYIVPRLSAGAWTVLTVIIRCTWGWKDETTASGRKEKDRLNYTQLQERTGLSRTAIARALRELRGIRKAKDGTVEQIGPAYIHREEAPRLRGGPEKPSYFYSLNTDLEIQVPFSSNESGLESSNESGLEKVAFPVTKVDRTKETLVNQGKKESGTKRRTRDPRLDHPAIKGYRGIAHLHIPIALRDDWIVCAEKVGVEFLLEKTKEWIGNGWKPTNINGIMDFAENGGLYSRLGKQARKRKGDLTDEPEWWKQYEEAGLIKA